MVVPQQRAVGLEHRVADDERDVEIAVGDGQGALERVVEVVLVVRRVLRFLDDEVAKARPAGCEVELPGGSQDGIAHGFRFKLPPVLSPQVAVINIDLRARRLLDIPALSR